MRPLSCPTQSAESNVQMACGTCATESETDKLTEIIKWLLKNKILLDLKMSFNYNVNYNFFKNIFSL